MRPQDLETRAGGSRFAHWQLCLLRCSVWCYRREEHQAGFDIRVHKVVEVLHYAPRQSNRRETLLGIALVKFEVSLDEGIEQGPRIKLEHTLLNKNLAERLFLIQDPRMNRPDQLVSADEVHLQREAAEQEIAIDV